MKISKVSAMAWHLGGLCFTVALASLIANFHRSVFDVVLVSIGVNFFVVAKAFAVVEMSERHAGGSHAV